MKWYFALSEASIDRIDHDWRGLIKVAVASAKKNTALKPFLLYDGIENPFLDELREMGVTVIHHRVSFYERLVESNNENKRPGYLSIASGTFMRVDLPVIETEDEYIFYSDCDVMFLKELDFSEIRPRYFSAAPQSSREDYENDMNAGVMVLNVPAMRAVRPWFIDFIIGNLHSGWPGFDQENYRRFFKGKWDCLPAEFNWKPYWGVSKAAAVVHWHGPKPELVQKLVKDPNLQTVTIWRTLFHSNLEGYRYYLQKWNELAYTLPPIIHGYMDIFSFRGAIGWAAYKVDAAHPASFVVWIDGEKVNEVVCDIPRADVEALYDVSVSGFAFKIPVFYLDGRLHKVELKDKEGRLVRLKRDGVLQDAYLFNA